MPKFFVTPFASAGNKTTVPEPVQPDGSISYTEGWGPDYELANTEPDYKPISREQTNQMFNDVTAALSEVQYNGVALWSIDGSGNYPINALVRHNDLLWQSGEDSNSTEPGGIGATWVDITLLYEHVSRTDNPHNVTAEQIGTFIPVGTVNYFDMLSAPSGWLKTNGASVSQTAYSDLYSIIENRYVNTWVSGEIITIGELRKSILDGTIYESTTAGTTAGSDVTDDTGVTWILSDNFQIPDYRGEFFRGLDDGRGVDVGRVLGSWQEDAIRNITGTIGRTANDATSQQTGGAFRQTTTLSMNLNATTTGSILAYVTDFDAARVVPVAAENRPRNIALLACIKY